MPYEAYMGTYIDENDHNLERKFGYKYRAFKSIYPNAYKLPEPEIRNAINVFYDGDAKTGDKDYPAPFSVARAEKVCRKAEDSGAAGQMSLFGYFKL